MIDLPPITRAYVALSALTTAATYTGFVSPYSLYFSWPLVWRKGEVWRLVTSFLFFDSQFSIELVFRLFMLVRYCGTLEENSFRGRTADFIVMLAFGALGLTLLAPFLHLQFLGSAFMITLVYLWSRRNRFMRLQIFGLFPVTAPYLPWVFAGMSLLMDHRRAVVVDLAGIFVGHCYYYLEDVYPRINPGTRLLRTPRFLKRLCGDEDAYRVAQHQERPVEFVPPPAGDAVVDEHEHQE